MFSCFAKKAGPRRGLGVLLLTSGVVFPALGWATTPLQVQTTTTELAWLAKKIGAEAVAVKSFLNGSENPHYVDATPSFALRAKRADLVITVGLDLEIGWLPRTLQRSGNLRVQPTESSPGYCEVGSSLHVHGKVTGKIDRSMGHLHSKGNPHFWYSLSEMSRAATRVLTCLKRAAADTLDPAALPPTLQTWEQNEKQLQERFVAEKNKLQTRLDSLTNKKGPIVELHEDFSYLFAELDLQSWGSLEEKPGVKPSAGRLSEVAIAAKRDKVRLLLLSSLDSKAVANKFSELSSIPNVALQAHLKRTSPVDTEDYFEVYWGNINRLLAALEPQP